MKLNQKIGGWKMNTWYIVYINTIAGRQWWDSYTNKKQAEDKIIELKSRSIYAYFEIH
jgi:hypothetical protein